MISLTLKKVPPSNTFRPLKGSKLSKHSGWQARSQGFVRAGEVSENEGTIFGQF